MNLAQYTDPLEHLHATNNALRKGITWRYEGGPHLLKETDSTTYQLWADSNTSLIIQVDYAPTCTAIHAQSKAPTDLVHKLPTKSNKDGVPQHTRDIPMIEHSCMFIDYEDTSVRETRITERIFRMHLGQPAPGRFVFDSIEYSTLGNRQKGGLKKHFRDITTKDFRPYVHRLLEIYSRVPKEEWHNPQIYHQETLSEKQLISAAQELLSAETQDRLKAAYLRSGQRWPSVPRLNLGAVELPTPYTTITDEPVFSGAPYLIEQLSALGIMNAPDAEKIVSQHLTNYLLRRTEFQLSKEKATTIVAMLEGKQ